MILGFYLLFLTCFLSARWISVYNQRLDAIVLLRERFRCSGVFRWCLSGGIRVRIPQELDVVAFWSWNLDIVAFSTLKKHLGITMPWLICLHFSMPWCFSPRISMSRFFGLGISTSWFFALGIPMSWYMCLHSLVFVIIVKTKEIMHNYVNYVVAGHLYDTCAKTSDIVVIKTWWAPDVEIRIAFLICYLQSLYNWAGPLFLFWVSGTCN